MRDAVARLVTSKLTDNDVLAIRADPRSQRALARAFGVSHTVIGQIKAGQLWRHV